MVSLSNVLAVILGGGRGNRLYPLTSERAKPAVPIAGRYRLIDIPISNCINSGINRIAVLTQFNSVSLHRHIARTYVFDSFHGGWVQIWAAEQTPRSDVWYQGTADAVRKQMLEIRTTNAMAVIILAGDHLYRMDYAALAAFHWEKEADITVAVQPVSRRDASRFGLCKRADGDRITSFVEKPTDPETLEEFVSRDDPQRPFLGSMGIYLFNTDVLVDLMENTMYDDFGKEVIPYAIDNYNVCGFDFDGYWEDIGTIGAFYHANLALTYPNPPFVFHDPEKPIYTRARFLPPSSIANTSLNHVFMAEGCQIDGAEISDSVIGLRSVISSGTRICETILMGADFYGPMHSTSEDQQPVGIGKNCDIEKAIIDKNAWIGDDVVIRPFSPGIDLDQDDWYAREGIIVIPKSRRIPPGTYIGPQ